MPRGTYNLCPTHGQRALGITADGGMAEQFRAPAARLVAVPPGLDLADASVVEPASVSWHALRLAGTGPAKRVAVVGAGALGLLAVAGARRMGAEDVALEARHPHQREAGERLGARVGAHGLYDVVVEAAGTPAGLARCREIVAPGWDHRRARRAFRSGPARLDAALPPRGQGDPVPRLLRPRGRPGDGGRSGHAGRRIRRSPVPSSLIASPSRTPARRSGWPATRPAAPSGW